MNKAKAEAKLKKMMEAQGATGEPNEETYVATAHEQAMAGDKEGAEASMQYGIKSAEKAKALAKKKKK